MIFTLQILTSHMQLKSIFTFELLYPEAGQRRANAPNESGERVKSDSFLGLRIQHNCTCMHTLHAYQSLHTCLSTRCMLGTPQ